MNERRTFQIREAIAAAQHAEKTTCALEQLVTSKFSALHHLVSLPESRPETTLIEFVTGYVERSPDIIDVLHELTLSAGVDKHTRKFLNIAEDYFLKPLELVSGHSGMMQLLSGAYLTYRLIEELNDRVAMVCGVPLAPIDMTMSNIIIHELLGEEFANQLDFAVHYSIESFFDANVFAKNQQFIAYSENRKQNGWGDVYKKWPFLRSDFSVSISLGDSAPEDLHH